MGEHKRGKSDGRAHVVISQSFSDRRIETASAAIIAVIVRSRCELLHTMRHFADGMVGRMPSHEGGKSGVGIAVVMVQVVGPAPDLVGRSWRWIAGVDYVGTLRPPKY